MNIERPFLFPSSEILKTIELIRDSFVGSREVYKNGSCIKLAMILKHIYPQGKILYDENHAIFEYDYNYYDIDGFTEKDAHVPLEEYGLLYAYNAMKMKADINFL